MSVFKITILISTIILSSMYPTQVIAQNSDISSEPLWMLILPGTVSKSDDQARENEITEIKGLVSGIYFLSITLRHTGHPPIRSLW